MTPAATIRLSNGIALDLSMTDRSFMGIGEVRADETVLRRAHPPMAPEIRSPDAVEFVDYEVVANGIGREGGELELRPKRRSAGLMEWMVHEVRNRYRVEDWSQPPQPAEDTRLWLAVRPVTRSVDGIICRGFAYQCRYRSASVPIYKILDRGSWEIGGTSVGNEIWQRGSFAPPIAQIERSDQRYSTEWYQPGAVNPNVFQFFPFQTHMQGFTFTVAEAGALITWSPRVSHIRTLIEKHPSCDAIFHLHEHCGDLTHEFETAPMEALWAPGRRDRVANINLYEAVREMVSEALHNDIGMRPERVVPYGVMEEWGPADFGRYTRLGVPKLLEAGAKRFFLPNHFANNMNTYGVSNMCCTVDYVVPESVGEANLRAFCEAVHAGGGQVEMWGNTAISTLTMILDKRNGDADRIRFLPREGGIMEAYAQTRDAWARNPSGAIEADHYTPVFAVTNLRDPVVRAYWLRRWREARERLGLDGIFSTARSTCRATSFIGCHARPPSAAPGRSPSRFVIASARSASRRPPSGLRTGPIWN
ncbi:MAG: hypothetical protein NTW86_00585 [Candidatus Sumerlaeota bacterium]|nr:hypothetical protein [Candidatus Sumerlaeota bacterium]